jgi:hypothetical protein
MTGEQPKKRRPLTKAAAAKAAAEAKPTDTPTDGSVKTDTTN